ncbi:MAG: hypothetical protein R3B54_12675 [Bdellovibrionota bacterium]
MIRGTFLFTCLAVLNLASPVMAESKPKGKITTLPNGFLEFDLEGGTDGRVWEGISEFVPKLEAIVLNDPRSIHVSLMALGVMEMAGRKEEAESLRRSLHEVLGKLATCGTTPHVPRKDRHK